MKVAILYICTGKYNQFFEGFYQSCERYFLKGVACTDYFVFTDDMKLCEYKNVFLFKRECQGFPKDSLFRFDMFLSIKDRLVDYDYCFFFNANMLFVANVGAEFLPEKEGLMAVVHPGYYKRWEILYPYERNTKSCAYIAPFEKPYHYFMGSLNGGKTHLFMKLAEICSANTHLDYERGIIAKVHDESHLNKYMHTHECKGLSPAYAYPEGWEMPFSPKIIIRDKVKFDPYFNKGRKFHPWARFKKGCGILWNVVRWYLRF